MKTRIIKRGDSYFVQFLWLWFFWSDVYLPHDTLEEAKKYAKELEDQDERWNGKEKVIE